MPDTGKLQIQVGLTPKINPKEFQAAVRKLDISPKALKIQIDESALTRSIQRTIINAVKNTPPQTIKVDAVVNSVAASNSNPKNSTQRSAKTNSTALIGDVRKLQQTYLKLKESMQTPGTSLFADRAKMDAAAVAELEHAEKKLQETFEALYAQKDKLTQQDIARTQSQISAYNELAKSQRQLQYGGYNQKSAGSLDRTFSKASRKAKGTIASASQLGIDSKELEDALARLSQTKSQIMAQDGRIIDSSIKAKNAYEAEREAVARLTADLREQIRVKTQAGSVTSLNDLDAFRARAKSSYQKIQGFLDQIQGGNLNSTTGLTALASQAQSLPAITDTTNIDELQRIVDLYHQMDSEMRRVRSSTTASNQINATTTNLKNLMSQVDRYVAANTKIRRNLGLFSSFQQLRSSLENSTIGVREARAAFASLRQQTIELGLETETLGSRLTRLFKDHLNTALVMGSLNLIRTGAQSIYEEVKKVDAAMTELRKVTDATSAQYETFLTNASSRAKELGASLSDVVTATADFARLGYSLDDASEIADAALVYKNVGDGIQDITEASESVISTMKAFGVDAEDAMSIVDKFNETGNNFAISSQGVGDAMKRSASALAAAGNTIDESIALITAANTVVQDPDVVGTAMKTLSMRLRGSFYASGYSNVAA